MGLWICLLFTFQPLPAPAEEKARASSTESGRAGSKAEERDRDILAHLNEVIRYFRMANAQIQKVGEPSDAPYRDEAAAQAGQIAECAFQSAKAEAALLDAYEAEHTKPTLEAPADETQTIQETKLKVSKRLAYFTSEVATLDQQLAKASPADEETLKQRRNDVQGALELTNAMAEAFKKVTAMSDNQTGAGLRGSIDRLQRSAPEMVSKAKMVATPLASIKVERSSGVTSQATVLFQLMATRQSIADWIVESGNLHAQALVLRTPLINALRENMKRGDMLSQQVADEEVRPVASPASGPDLKPDIGKNAELTTRKRFESATASFKALSESAIALSQEILLLEQAKANLVSWRVAVNDEYHEVLSSLLLRVFCILIALGIIQALNKGWKMATAKYVLDSRRRRQFQSIRRLLVGFSSGLVLIIGFVTQFNSLTTFGGFVTAGLAVGLQTILLSVAAYFFIIGRYGIRVGDRISVAGVSGDVIDVGLVRFYIMELAGSGTELHSTGRVAVFSNSVLFQAGTPLYKQLPGTEYVWHELVVKLSITEDYQNAADAMLNAIKEIYNPYRSRIEVQHRRLEAWMDSTVVAPGIESRLQLVDAGGLELSVRFPVERDDATNVDQKITHSVLTLLSEDARVKAAVLEPPAIKATVRG
jgi:small-conductance mechanosensitive channel